MTTVTRIGGKGLWRTAWRMWLAAVFVLAAACGAKAAAQALQPGGPIDFGTQAVGSAVKSYSVTFSATSTTTIESVSALTLGIANLDFTIVSQNCTGVQAPPATCSVTVGFSPTAPGLRRGALLITDNTGVVVNKIFLHGVGTAVQAVISPPTASSLTSLTGSVSPTGFTASGIVADGSEALYFNDAEYSRLLRRDPTTGKVTVVSLMATTSNTSMAIDGGGSLYITVGTSVYKMTPGAGNATVFPTGSIVLVAPRGVAVDAVGDVYIADAQLNEIVRVATDGTSSVVGVSGATLSGPTGLAVNNTNLYVANTASNQVLSIALSTGATTVLPGTYSYPEGVAVDAAGNVAVTDTGNKRVAEVTAGGTVFTLPLAGVTLNSPAELAAQANGDLVVADPRLGLVNVARSAGALTFATATHVAQLDSTDGAMPVYVVNSGTNTLEFAVPSTGANPAISTTAFAVASGSSCPTLNSASTAVTLASGQGCLYNLDFTPTQSGTNTATATITVAPTGGTPTTAKTVTLTGTGLTNTASFGVTAAPATTRPGSAVTVTVSALDASGVVDPTYVGTVTITATDSTATFPNGKTYTFAAADKGTHAFTVDLNALGTFTVSASDGTHTGTSNPVLVEQANGFSVSATPNVLTPGGDAALTITATFNGTPVTSYTGTVTLTATDPAAKFLSGTTYTFTAGDAGTHTFAAAGGVQFNTVGTWTVSARDTNGATGTSNPVQVVAADSFAVVATPATTQTGVPVGYTVTAQYKGATATQFAGTVTFTSTDPAVRFLNGGSYTFTTADAGTHTFAAANGVAFNTPGTQTVTATAGALTGTSNAVQVTGVNGFTITAAPATTTPGTPVGFTVSATYNGTVVPGYTGTVSFGATDPKAVFLSGNTYTFTATDAGTHTFAAAGGVEFNSIGSFTVSAGDGTHTGVSNPVTVTATATISLGTSASPVLTGTQVTLTASLTGQGNLTPTGTVTFYDGTTALGKATIAGNSASLAVTLTALGTHTITAVYSGDANFGPVTSGALSEVIEDFTVTLAPGTAGSQSVLGGHVATYTVLVSPLGGSTLAAPVTLTLSGAPTGSTVLLQPPSVAAGAASMTVTVSVTPTVVGMLERHELPLDGGARRGIELASLLLLPLGGWMARRRRFGRLLVLALALVPLSAATGCISASQNGYYGGAPQTYPLVVTGTSGTLTRTVNLTLTVQ